jgi:signal transduction histidine kinase
MPLEPIPEGFNASRTTPTQAPAELDVLSALKLSQAISSEMVFSRLVPTLMRIVVESAGASRGFLALVDGDTLTVAAEIDVNEPVGVLLTGAKVEEPGMESRLPLSLIQYVRRIGESVLTGDDWALKEFSNDPYLLQHRPRSLLCMPIARQGRLVGVLYLENQLVRDAFDAKRLSVLELLAAQMAISLENSTLYRAAQEAIRLRDEFLSIASHELRTPLTPLKLQLQQLSRTMAVSSPDVLRARISAIAVNADRHVNRLRRLIGDLLDVTRISAGKLTLSLEPVDLAAITREVADRQTEVFANAGSQLKIEAPDSLVGVWDGLRVEQLLQNLLGNAVKYGAGREVCVSLMQEDSDAVLRVRDEGIGIDPSAHQRIFERFERAVSSNYGGLGLGLYIVRQITDAHGGSVGVQSAAGKGATFTVRLPLRSPN